MTDQERARALALIVAVADAPTGVAALAHVVAALAAERLEERRAIAAFLRGGYAAAAADAIERGDHRS